MSDAKIVSPLQKKIVKLPDCCVVCDAQTVSEKNRQTAIGRVGSVQMRHYLPDYAVYIVCDAANVAEIFFGSRSSKLFFLDTKPLILEIQSAFL